jgi:hypothetical protein
MIHRELAARRQRKGGNNAEQYDRLGQEDDDAGMEGVVEEVTAAAARRATTAVITTSSRCAWQDLSDQELWALLEQMDQKGYADDDSDDEEEAEIEERMASENQFWDEQYEQWRQQQQGHNDYDDDHDDDLHDADTAVPCPICYQGRLVQEDDDEVEGSTVICCSKHDSMNHMMADDDGDDRCGSCPFRLVLSQHDDDDHRPLTLADLADRLRVVHQDHARLNASCRQLPRIMIQQSMPVDNDQRRQPTTTTLVTAHCAACGMQRQIV